MLKKYTKFIYILLMLITTNVQSNDMNNIYQYSFKDIDGNKLNLDSFKGKPILLVNTASKCGFTPQYGDLQNLFKIYEKSNKNSN